MRINELELIFLNKVKTNPTYTETLTTLDEGEVHKYDDDKKTTRPVGINLKRLERRFMEEPRSLERKTICPKHPPRMVTVIAFCYEEEPQTKTDIKNNNILFKTWRNTKTSTVYTDRSKTEEKKVGFSAVFLKLT